MPQFTTISQSGKFLLMLREVITKKLLLLSYPLVLAAALQGCTVMPQTGGLNESRLRGEVGNGIVRIREINPQLLQSLSLTNVKGDTGCAAGMCPESWDYIVGPGDVLSIVVWEHPQLTIPAGPNRSPAEAGNRIHGDGTIFYPYIGKVRVSGKTVSEVRDLITEGLKKIIPEPQVDVSVAHFRENNKVYVLGEISQPGPLVLGMSRVSLTDAISRAGGIEKLNANARSIFVFRSGSRENVDVFRLDARSPSAFLWGTQFNLQAQDVVYVTAAPAARWGRIISKIVPSLAALNTLLILDDRL
jgi:polysaccharide export outer membrane protein